MKTVDELMALVDDLAQAHYNLGNGPEHYDSERCDEARAALLTALQESQDTLTFYKHRVELLQEWQSKMRDPERTIACDIIANGQMLPDPHGTRYSPELQEPVAWRENKTGVLSATLRDERLWTPLYAAPQGAPK